MRVTTAGTGASEEHDETCSNLNLRIGALELREIQLPLREPFQISTGTVATRRIFLLQLHHPDGVAGWAECVAGERPDYSPETTDTAWIITREVLGPAILNVDFAHPTALHRALEEAACGHPMAKAAIEMGSWELSARIRGVPLCKVLGGEHRAVPTGISLGIQASPEILVEKARSALAQGYRRVKIKIKPGADLAYALAVRQALGPEANLMVDANAAYSPSDAKHLARFDELGLTMIEQPLARDDLVQHAELQKKLATPICLDESITSPDRAEDMIALGSGRIINIKPGRVGGFTNARFIHDLCGREGVPVWCGGMLESGIGRGHNVALASMPNFRHPGDISPSARYWERDIVRPEWTMGSDGMVEVPMDQPGIGVEVDLDRVDDLTVRREMVTN